MDALVLWIVSTLIVRTVLWHGKGSTLEEIQHLLLFWSQYRIFMDTCGIFLMDTVGV
jgi:hypothetical protein